MMTLRTVRRIAYFAFVASAAKAEGGLPQLDPTWYGNQLLWLAISFVLLYVLVSGVIAPTIHHVLKDRADAIDAAIAEAEKAKLAAESSRGSAESAIHTARAKAAEMVVAAQVENSREAAEAIAKLDHELARKADQAQARIQEALAKAHEQLGAATADLANTMAEKLIGVGSADSGKIRKKA